MLRCLSLLVTTIVLAFGTVVRADEPIYIGHYGSLTGPEATFGISTSNGIKLAIKELNAAGGINGRLVELIEYDTKGDPKEGGNAVTRLVTHDKVPIVLGEVASSVSLAGAPICQKYQVPMISPSSTNPRVTLVGDYIFRVCFIDEFQGYVAAKFAIEHQKAMRVAILEDQSSAYSTGLADFFEKYYTEMGGEITTRQKYPKGESNFTSRLTPIRATNPDMIYVPGYYTDVANIAIQARKLGLKMPLFGGDGWDSAELISIGKEAIEGCFFSNHAAPDEPKMLEFAEKYRNEYEGAEPDALGALGYDAANVAFDAMKRAKAIDGPSIREALVATKFDGVTGMVAFNETRDTTKGAVMVEVKDGELVLAERIDPK